MRWSVAQAPGTRASPGRSAERGFTLLEVMLVVSIIALVASFAVPSMQDARRVANEAAAIAMVRSIFDAEQQYNRKLGTPSAPFASSLPVLESAELLPGGLVPAGGGLFRQRGYNYSISFDDASLSFRIHAVPIGATEGSFSFLALEDGLIFRRKPPTLFSDPSEGEPIGK
jgi:prepilin-type N-terminal cleavage/methylation domain-containing protein